MRTRTWLLWLALLVALAGLIAAARSAEASAGTTTNEKWVPGIVLVRFAGGTTAQRRKADAKDTGTTIEAELPLVPELYRLGVAAGETVPQAVEKLDREPGVVYAQPDSIVDDTRFALPNNTYFSGAPYANQGFCADSSTLSQWPLWPRGQNLIPENPAYDQYYSINVVPVWDALLAAHRPFGKTGPNQTWSAADLRRSGIGIHDTGLSNNPDVEAQVAALFSTTTLGRGDSSTDLLTEVYRDAASRPDLQAVRTAVNPAGSTRRVHVTDANRPLFALDDTETMQSNLWDPLGEAGPELPRGCDGHGTQVASVAAGTANGGQGLAGVGYNVPVVGVRAGMPWDAAGTQLANDGNLRQAATAWAQSWRQEARSTVENDDEQLAALAALGLPVVNESGGEPMFDGTGSVNGRRLPVVRDPVAVEAWARLFSSGNTLGVVAAGNQGENRGTGPGAVGAQPRDFDLPCSLRLLRNRPLAVSDGNGFRAWQLDIDWNKLLEICVGATTSNNSELWKDSAYGTSVVDLAAPGVGIAVATRPRALRGGGVDRNTYQTNDGTSFSAPMVAGAAALLREAAPGAPMRIIRQALLSGAQPVPALLGKVTYGQLDVACSLEWLSRQSAHHTAEWDLVNTLGSEAFQAAAKGCQRKLPYRVQTTVSVSKSDLYENKKWTSLSALLTSKLPGVSPTSPSLAWQRAILGGIGITRPYPGRAAFTIGPTPSAINPAGGGPVYNAGTLVLACSRQNFELAGVAVRIVDAIRPSGWFYPTDASSPWKGVELGLVLQKPWFSAFMPAKIEIAARATCEYKP